MTTCMTCNGSGKIKRPTPFGIQEETCPECAHSMNFIENNPLLDTGNDDLFQKSVKPEPIPFEWEKVTGRADIMHQQNTSRAKVLGGWILREILIVGDEATCLSTTFIPDPLHQWEVAKDEN